MTGPLERPTTEPTHEDTVISPIKLAVEAHVALVNSEPAGRNDLICSALMLGSPALRSQVQV